MILCNCIGNLVDAAKEVQGNETTFLSFRVAVNFYYKDKECTLFVEATSNDVSKLQWLTKGRQIYFGGNMAFYTYTDGNNELRLGAKCRIQNLRLI